MKRISFLLLLIGLLYPGITSLNAQAVLANPSFEITGSGATVFNGWNQWGTTDSSPVASHGFLAARLSGQNNGSANESGYWQRLNCAVNEQWQISGNVLNTESAALTGDCVAVVKVEWRNAGDAQIDFDSFVVADAASPAGSYIPFNLLSSPAPAGTVAIRLVLGVMQAQNSPSPSVCFDQISCLSTASPTLDEIQWVDFPGGRTLQFADKAWRVKGSGWYGPGPNNFSHLPENVWVDDLQRLHVTIKQNNNVWYSTEVTLEDALGYGDYIFTSLGSLNQLNERTVLGLFLWQYNNGVDSWWNPYNEIDIEYSRWGNPTNAIGQYVAQPWDWAGNIFRYDASFSVDQLSSHAFNWLPDRVEFRSWLGGPDDETAENLISSWTYLGPHIPRPEQPRVHINLWYASSPPSVNQEVIISDFSFIPANGSSEISEQVSVEQPMQTQQNYPNPFNRNTKISFVLSREGKVQLDVFDIKGRKVATLLNEAKKAGYSEVEWDATGYASGIYFYRIQFGGKATAHKMILLR
jgi:hypothetical protein